jgi:predicted transposase YbfD/YdcC
MNLTTFDPLQETMTKEQLSIDPHSLYRAFEQVKDGRKRRGKRYPLALIFTLVLLGKLAGETTLSGIVDWVKWRETWLRKQLDWPKRFPSLATYTRALANCNGEEVAQVAAQVLTRARVRERDSGMTEAMEQAGSPLSQVAVDGKTLRGTLNHHQEHQPAVHILSWYEPATGMVLAHRAVEHKRNEISTLLPWLSPTLVKNRIVTADAMHTQRELCADIIRFGGHYVLIAKKNQPTLYQDLHLFFTDPQADEGEWQQEQQYNKGHGRLEQRRIRTTTLLTPLFQQKWAGIGQAFEVRRRVTHPLKCTQQIVYGITSLTPAQANPARILSLLRTHWQIENPSHYRRDVTLEEDASQVRTAGAPLALAALNGTVLALMDWLQVSNVPAQMRRFCARPHEALQLLCGTLLR